MRDVIVSDWPCSLPAETLVEAFQFGERGEGTAVVFEQCMCHGSVEAITVSTHVSPGGVAAGQLRYLFGEVRRAPLQHCQLTEGRAS